MTDTLVESETHVLVNGYSLGLMFCGREHKLGCRR